LTSQCRVLGLRKCTTPFDSLQPNLLFLPSLLPQSLTFHFSSSECLLRSSSHHSNSPRHPPPFPPAYRTRNLPTSLHHPFPPSSPSIASDALLRAVQQALRSVHPGQPSLAHPAVEGSGGDPFRYVVASSCPFSRLEKADKPARPQSAAMRLTGAPSNHERRTRRKGDEVLPRGSARWES
jgi:hypothetical protein